jgi:enamine deaminase RidA (YjgF/YER057c/UK114 family)
VSAEQRLAELGIMLADPFPPAGSYVNAVRTGDLLVLGGHIPWDPPDRVVLGKLGDALDVGAGRAAARLAAISALSTLRHELGSLDAVRQIVSLRGVVNATPDFVAHTQVIDGASDVLIDVFGAAGRHARLAVGVSSLPVDLALEIELLVEVEVHARR